MPLRALRRPTVCVALFVLTATEGIGLAQQPPVCVPGTPLCARGNGNGGAQGGGSVQVGPNGVRGSANGNADASGNGNGNGSEGQGDGDGSARGGHHRSHGYTGPYGTGVTLCATLKVGVFSGYKGGGCVAVSFRTPGFFFEMETQLLYGGTRHSVDWLFPMSFVIPLTSEPSMFEGLHLRVGGSPIGVTFASADNGGTYLRFGLHAGITYEMRLGSTVSWRVFDARAFLDFGTKQRVDRLGDFLDFGGQLSTGIVL
jgi:hypothetical protein